MVSLSCKQSKYSHLSTNERQPHMQQFHISKSAMVSITLDHNKQQILLLRLRLSNDTLKNANTQSDKASICKPFIKYSHTFKKNIAESFLFMAKILSYFYEKYAYTRFKLFYQIDHTLPMTPINCSIGLNDLPAIQEVTQHNGETRLHYTHPCILEKIVRIQQTHWTNYTVHFTTSKMQNIAQQPLKYLNATTRLQTLDFKWPYINQTAYKLVIQVKLKRQKLPTIWWILPYTDSLLTYHKNLFAPSSINTIATTYSYAFKNKHYYRTGRCIPHCRKNTLSQKIKNKPSQIFSWPLPRQVINGLTPVRLYCLPQCGIVETHMKIFHQQVPSLWPHSFSDRCHTHSSNFTTLSRQLTTVFLNLPRFNPSLNTTIYSYQIERPIAFSGPLQTYKYELSYLNRRLMQKTLMFETLWHHAYPKYKQLEKIITEKFLLHDESLFHQSELLHYSKNQHDIDRNVLKMTTASYLETLEIRNFKNAYYNLHEWLARIQTYTTQIYSFKYMSIILQFIQNKTTFQHNVIYAHTFRDGHLQSTPLVRILSQTHNPSINTLTVSHSTERTKNPKLTTHASSSQTDSITNVTSTVPISAMIAPNSTLTPTYATSTIIPESLTSTIQSHTHTRQLTIEILLSKLTKSVTRILNRSYFIFNSVRIATSSYLIYIYLTYSLKHANAIILFIPYKQTYSHNLCFRYTYTLLTKKKKKKSL